MQPSQESQKRANSRCGCLLLPKFVSLRRNYSPGTFFRQIAKGVDIGIWEMEMEMENGQTDVGEKQQTKEAGLIMPSIKAQQIDLIKLMRDDLLETEATT